MPCCSCTTSDNRQHVCMCQVQGVLIHAQEMFAVDAACSCFKGSLAHSIAQQHQVNKQKSDSTHTNVMTRLQVVSRHTCKKYNFCHITTRYSSLKHGDVSLAGPHHLWLSPCHVYHLHSCWCVVWGDQGGHHSRQARQDSACAGSWEAIRPTHLNPRQSAQPSVCPLPAS